MASGLLERVRQLQDAPVVAVPADDLQADRQPARRESAGTEIAGFAMNVTYQHDRIQSMYVVIGVAGDSASGTAIVTSNGSTCVTGSTKYS